MQCKVPTQDCTNTLIDTAHVHCVWNSTGLSGSSSEVECGSRREEELRGSLETEKHKCASICNLANPDFQLLFNHL